MGGAAFRQAVAAGHPTLNTPRMTPDEYGRLKETYLAKIRGYFSERDVKVAVLKEAPEKLSYGDIDLFIGLDKQVDFMHLANTVGATGLIVHSAGDVQKCTMGVLTDRTPSQHPTILYQTIDTSMNGSAAHSPTDITPEAYAQIDINVISLELVDWHTFYSAYGDLNGLFGHILTHLGFTVTDRGLWLRMKELDAAKDIERVNVADHLGKLFLSRDPAQVMSFLGLSVEVWNAGFATLDQLYEWLSACRMLHPVAIKLRRDKAHERKREERRDVYRRFFFDWLPERMPEMSRTSEKDEQRVQIAQLRQRYLDEALDFFDKRAIYNEVHRVMVSTVDGAIAANLLRPLITKHSGAKAKKLAELVRAFRRFVEFDEDRRPCVAAVAHTDADSQLPQFLNDEKTGLANATGADEFVQLRWQTLKERERQRAKGRLGQGDIEQDE